MPIKDFDDILNDKNYLPNSKLTAAQIADGWIEIESEEQLLKLSSKHCDFLNEQGDVLSTVLADRYNNGVHAQIWIADTLPMSWSARQLTLSFIAYRPLPSYEEYQALKVEHDKHDAWADKLIAKNDELSFKIIELEKQLTAAANNGKTLRDEIAINAMQGMLTGITSYDPTSVVAAGIATDSYVVADAMLEARKGGGV